ncbi:hypothetical protein CUMW_244540 [Citrus unshiu]|uniref:Uncharacterized protein n=1 Tax=Citrus unshiu TaxID=55188 RepID=A0A2H5QMP6_CITUN|nr:hypothetical protein CUMW_244540 [Citrus unshiu]
MLATQESVPIRKPKSSRTANSSFTPSPSLSLRQRSSGIKASISGMSKGKEKVIEVDDDELDFLPSLLTDPAFDPGIPLEPIKSSVGTSARRTSPQTTSSSGNSNEEGSSGSENTLSEGRGDDSGEVSPLGASPPEGRSTEGGRALSRDYAIDYMTCTTTFDELADLRLSCMATYYKAKVGRYDRKMKEDIQSATTRADVAEKKAGELNELTKVKEDLQRQKAMYEAQFESLCNSHRAQVENLEREADNQYDQGLRHSYRCIMVVLGKEHPDLKMDDLAAGVAQHMDEEAAKEDAEGVKPIVIEEENSPPRAVPANVGEASTPADVGEASTPRTQLGMSKGKEKVIEVDDDELDFLPSLLTNPAFDPGIPLEPIKSSVGTSARRTSPQTTSSSGNSDEEGSSGSENTLSEGRGDDSGEVSPLGASPPEGRSTEGGRALSRDYAIDYMT